MYATANPFPSNRSFLIKQYSTRFQGDLEIKYLPEVDFIEVKTISLSFKLAYSYHELTRIVHQHFNLDNKLLIKLNISFFTVESLIHLEDFIEELNSFVRLGKHVSVFWQSPSYFLDEMKELGYDLLSLAKFEFETNRSSYEYLEN